MAPPASTSKEDSQKGAKKDDKNEPPKRKIVVPPMILQSDRHWKNIHSWMVKYGVDSRSKITLDGDLHIELLDYLQKKT